MAFMHIGDMFNVAKVHWHCPALTGSDKHFFKCLEGTREPIASPASGSLLQFFTSFKYPPPDKLAPARKLWDAWTALLPLLFEPGPAVTMDEKLAMFKGEMKLNKHYLILLILITIQIIIFLIFSSSLPLLSPSTSALSLQTVHAQLPGVGAL